MWLFLLILQQLNTNHTLYAAVRKAEQDSNLLTEEASRTAHHLRMDFERGGIHLDPGLCYLHYRDFFNPFMMCLFCNLLYSFRREARKSE